LVEHYYPYGGTAIIAGKDKAQVQQKRYRYTGKVKMVAVGYGREAEDGTQTLGGRSVNELSTNIRSGLVFWDSVVSLLVCSWVKFSQDWIFLSW
jgi:hypothetical protein